MVKVCILAIDALDFNVIEKYRNILPNISLLRKESPQIELRSVSPPDSNTAWASIYTGWNPARHGIFHFVDPLERVVKTAKGEIDNTVLQGNTFWDKVSDFGKKVTLIFPHHGYPVWKVNGIMLGRSAFDNLAPLSFWPKNLSKKYSSEDLNVISGFSGGQRNFNQYLKKAKQLIRNETKVSLELFKQSDWDLFMTYSSVLDTIQHNFWNYFDKSDPDFKGENNYYYNIIPKFYTYYDTFIGEFLKRIDNETVFMVFSDHGHGMRPVRLLNINEVLRRKRFLSTKGKVRPPLLTIILEIVKKKALEIISTYNLSKQAMKVVKLVPMAKQVYTKPTNINWKKTQAYMIDMSGIKSYSYGGIMINRNIVSETELEKIKEEIIKLLLTIKDPQTGKKAFKWVKSKDEIFHGRFIDTIPDIVYQMEEDIGGGISTDSGIFGISKSHSVVPGSHKLYTPVLFIKNSNKKVLTSKASIIDIAPTILDILDIPYNLNNFDGVSVFRNSKKPRYLYYL